MFAEVGWVRDLPTKLTAIQTALVPEAPLVAKARALLVLIHLLAPIEQRAVLQGAVAIAALIAAVEHIADDLLGLLHVCVFQGEDEHFLFFGGTLVQLRNHLLDLRHQFFGGADDE